MAVVVMASMLAVLFGLSLQSGVASASTVSVSHAVQDPAPNGDSGTTIDPLQYNCGNDAPTCGQVGESNGYYNGTNVDLLYSEDYYCDPAVTPAATATGCEVGAAPSSPNPTGMSANGTMLGNTKHSDTLYIPVPLFSQPAGHPVHGDSDLYRPSSDHQLVSDRGRSSGQPVALIRGQRADSGPRPCRGDQEQRSPGVVERRSGGHDQPVDVRHT